MTELSIPATFLLPRLGVAASRPYCSRQPLAGCGTWRGRRRAVVLAMLAASVGRNEPPRGQEVQILSDACDALPCVTGVVG